MNTNAILIYYTSQFGEHLHPFMITELQQLSKHHKEVHLFCLDAICGYSELNKIKNVFIHPMPRYYRYIRIYMILPSLFNKELQDNIKLAKKDKKMDFGFWRSLSRIILPGKIMAKEIDKLITNNQNKWFIESFWMDASAYAAAVVKEKHNNVTAITRVHSVEIDPIKNRYYKYEMKNYIYSRLDAICFISNYGKEFYEKNIFSSYFSEKPLKDKLFRLGCIKKLSGINSSSQDDKFRIISCSRITSVKRIELLAQIARKLQESNILWKHIGTGEDYEKISLILKNQNLIPSEFLIGDLENIKVQEIMANEPIDMLVNVSSSEGVPVSIMEAMSYGIPVLCTNAGGSNEIVNDDNGKIIPINITSQELYNAICEMKNRSDRKIIKKNAYETWKKEYDMYYNFEKFWSEFN
ncbi:MAG: glycosyltransferase [Clostridium cadaveris]|uniref:glycosyltransferase n=1 Tax=Clostridium cadaveris TaxID=1529 RepID=UPI002A897581|nr:glycosyltransferase [Clostridium cadaveris]